MKRTNRKQTQQPKSKKLKVKKETIKDLNVAEEKGEKLKGGRFATPPTSARPTGC